MRVNMKAAGVQVAGVLIGAQGVAGVTCVAAGTFMVAGIGVALLVLGGFLLLGAWATR